MNRELSLAGVGARQVLGGAGVHAGVVGAGVEDNQGIFWVVVNKGEVAALREKHVILQQIRYARVRLRTPHALQQFYVKYRTLNHRMSGSGLPSTTTARRHVSPMCTSTSSMMVSNLGGTAKEEKKSNYGL